jgi:hypothetical protein
MTLDGRTRKFDGGPSSTHKRPSSMYCERPLFSEFKTVRLFDRRCIPLSVFRQTPKPILF